MTDSADLTDLPLVKRSLSEEVVVHLRNAIWSGKLLPGEHLKEMKLAQSLGVSRGPIREAIDQLEREGLIVKERNKTARVARLSKKDLQDVFSLRLAFERLALELAVEYASPDDLDRLQSLIDSMTLSVETGITEQDAAHLDMQFHEAVICASQNQRLYDYWQQLRSQIYVFLLQVRASLRNRNELNQEFLQFTVLQHQKLLDAIRKGDKAYLSSLIEEHVYESYHRVVETYQFPEDIPHE